MPAGATQRSHCPWGWLDALWSTQSQMCLCAASMWKAVLSARSRSCAPYLRFAGPYIVHLVAETNLLAWNRNKWARVQLLLPISSSARKYKEPSKDRRKVHLNTILLLVTASRGSLDRNIRAQQASDPSTEYSPKIQGFVAQVLPKGNGGNFVFRSPWQIFIVIFSNFEHIYILLHLFLLRCFAV